MSGATQETEKFVYRVARDKRERMYAAVNFKNENLFEYNGRIVVTGKNKTGENLLLGDISIQEFYQINHDWRDSVDYVLFGGDKKSS